MHWIVFVGAGLAVGVAFGLFGAGGSAFATPVLALLGVPPAIAVASPLPAMLPASFVGARQYLRAGLFDRRTAKLVVLAGLPAVVLGSAASQFVGGVALLGLSGLVLLVLGVRMVWPSGSQAATRGASRRDQRGVVIGLAAGAAFFSGLLANGGGFLLVPIFVLVLGLTAARAAGTSLVVAVALTVPTIVAHWLLGDINWAIAGAFAVGLVPASMLGARLGLSLHEHVVRPAFGVVLTLFAIYFLTRQFA